MDGFLRQSTAVTVSIGPFLDSGDGDAEEPSLTIAQADVRLKKAGGAGAQKNNATSATHDEDGMYDCPLSTTDTNTLGILVLYVHVAGALYAKHTFAVIPANIWDSWFATDLQDVNVAQFGGSNGTFASGRPEVNTSHIGGTLQTANDVGADVDAILVDTADMQPKLGAPAASLAADIAAVKVDTGNLVTRITSTLFAGITSLAEWLGLIAGKQVGDTTARTELRATGAGSGTFDETTDSQEAIRDAGATLADINAEVDTALADIHLDHLLAVTYDPASKPGVADALLNELIESDAGVSRFTANALEQGPSAGGGDATEAKQDTIIALIGTPAADLAADIAAVKVDSAAILVDTADMQPKLGAPAVSLAADIAAVKVDTAATLVDTGTTLPATLATADGKLDTIAGYLDTEIQAIIDALALINTDTDDIQARLPAALVGGRMSSSVGAINGDAAAAIRLALSAGVIIPGTVDSTGHTPTTTEFEADDITEATADHYNGRVIIFTSGALLGQATSISDYALATGRGHFTVAALTEAPANNTTFIIV